MAAPVGRVPPSAPPAPPAPSAGAPPAGGNPTAPGPGITFGEHAPMAEMDIDIDFEEEELGDPEEKQAFAVDPQRSWPGVPSQASPPRRLHYNSLGNGLIVTLVIAGPILLVEANWRGASLTHQPHKLWLLAGLGVAVAFFAGGMVAGRRRRRPEGALYQGLALAAMAWTALVVAAVFRLVVLLPGFPHLSTLVWWVVGIVVGTALSCAGALYGRWSYIRSREKRRG